MSAIEKLFPASPQERSFQMKARRDAGTAAPNWVPPQFVECKKCGRRATRQVWVKSQYVCPNCGVHLAIGAYYRLSTVLDHGTFKELNPDIAPNDVLHFPDYQEKLAAASVKTGLKVRNLYERRRHPACAGAPQRPVHRRGNHRTERCFSG